MNNPILKRKPNNPFYVPNARYAGMQADVNASLQPGVAKGMGGSIEEVVVRPPKPTAPLAARVADTSTGSLNDTAKDMMKKPLAKLKPIIPYVSNVANSFITPKRQSAPHLQSSVSLGRVSMGSSRAGISQRVREADLGTRSLDGNTGSFVRAANLGQGLKAIADVNEREAITNAEIGAREASLNAGIEQSNLSKMDDYNNQSISRDSAIKSGIASNISNAVDKFVAGENLKTDRDSDLQKAQIIMSANKGVSNRMLDRMLDEGTLSQAQYDSYKAGKFKYGGKLKKAFN